MANRVYIEDDDLANRVYLEVAANKYSEPAPEEPKRSYVRFGAGVRTVPGWDGASITPGRTIHFDAGSDQSSGSITIEIPLLLESERASLETKYLSAEPVRYSPDDGTNIWRCVFAPGESFSHDQIVGFPGHFTASIKLNIIEKVA